MLDGLSSQVIQLKGAAQAAQAAAEEARLARDNEARRADAASGAQVTVT